MSPGEKNGKADREGKPVETGIARCVLRLGDGAARHQMEEHREQRASARH